mgnify:FL=1
MEASAGIGFAIPAAIVQKVVPSLIEDGTYAHPWIGISGITLDPDAAKAMDLDANQRGALVVDVIPDSPADEAGLQGSARQITVDGADYRIGGDVLTAIDGEPIQTFDDVVAYLMRSTEVGQTVKLTLLREGQERTVEVTLSARPATETREIQPEAEARKNGSGWLGIMGITMTPEIAAAMDLSETQTGVLVEQIESGSPADESGLRGS